MLLESVLSIVTEKTIFGIWEQVQGNLSQSEVESAIALNLSGMALMRCGWQLLAS